MTIKCMVRAVLVLGMTSASLPLQAQDFAREDRLANQIVDAIFDGEPTMLEADGREFLSIYMESDADEPRGAAIVLHGRGFHPDWPEVAQPLRVGLTEHGWHTLSLQMPVLEKTAKYYDYVPIIPSAFPRISSGVAYLRELGVNNIVLIAHSCSVHMSLAYLEENGDEAFSAFVGIGMGATDYQQPMAKPLPLDKLKVPVLDIYGSEDFPAVLRLAPDRLDAMKQAGNPASDQRMIPEAEHYFRGQEEALIEEVAQWLEGLPH